MFYSKGVQISDFLRLDMSALTRDFNSLRAILIAKEMRYCSFSGDFSNYDPIGEERRFYEWIWSICHTNVRAFDNVLCLESASLFSYYLTMCQCNVFCLDSDSARIDTASQVRDKMNWHNLTITHDREFIDHPIEFDSIFTFGRFGHLSSTDMESRLSFMSRHLKGDGIVCISYDYDIHRPNCGLTQEKMLELVDRSSLRVYGSIQSPPLCDGMSSEWFSGIVFLSN